YMRAILAARFGDEAEARAQLAALDEALPHAANNFLATLAGAAARFGTPELQRRLHARLAPLSDTFATWGLFGLTCGSPIEAVLDATAREKYRARAAELAAIVETAEARGDAARALAAQRELEVLQRELARAVGLGGRSRRAGAAAERARITAQRRLREAIRKI